MKPKKQSIADVISRVEEAEEYNHKSYEGINRKNTKESKGYTSNSRKERREAVNREERHTFFWTMVTIVVWIVTVLVTVGTIASGFGTIEFRFGTWINAVMGLISLKAYRRTKLKSAEVCALVNLLSILAVIVMAVVETGLFKDIKVEL